MDVFTAAQQKSFDDFMTVYRSGDEHSHYGGHSLLFYALANSNSESRYRIATFLLNQHADLGDVDSHKNNLLHILFRGFNQKISNWRNASSTGEWMQQLPIGPEQFH